jgi:hypothetical protein
MRTLVLAHATRGCLTTFTNFIDLAKWLAQLTDINAKLLGEAAAKLAANGATVTHVTCDVSDRISVHAACRRLPHIF